MAGAPAAMIAIRAELASLPLHSANKLAFVARVCKGLPHALANSPYIYMCGSRPVAANN